MGSREASVVRKVHRLTSSSDPKHTVKCVYEGFSFMFELIYKFGTASEMEGLLFDSTKNVGGLEDKIRQIDEFMFALEFLKLDLDNLKKALSGRRFQS